MTTFGVSKAEELLPIMAEFTLASACYLTLMLKKSPSGNFALAIAYSSFKMLALCALYVTNFTVTGFVHLPLLLGLLLNELVILFAFLRDQHQLETIVIRSMYPRWMLALRAFGELATISVFLGLGLGTSLVPCNCTMRPQRIPAFLREVEPSRDACVWQGVTLSVSLFLAPQLRALAFVIATTASAVSVGGWQYMLMGFHSSLKRQENDDENLSAMLRDYPWKKVVRTVYCFLALVTVALFAVTFFAPGFRECGRNVETLGYKPEEPRFMLGSLSHAYLNAMLAISQMFVADVCVRLSAVREVEEGNGLVGADGHLDDRKDAAEWVDRAESAIIRLMSRRCTFA